MSSQAQRGVARCDTARRGTARHSVAPHCMGWHSQIQHGTAVAWHGTSLAQPAATWRSVARNSRAWRSMAGAGTAWHGQGQHGVAQDSMTRRSTARDWHGAAQNDIAEHWDCGHSGADRAGCPVPRAARPQVVSALPPAGRELPLCWVPVEDTPTVPGVTWKTLTVRPPCSGQSPATHGEHLGVLAAPGRCLGAGGPRVRGVGRALRARGGGC